MTIHNQLATAVATTRANLVSLSTAPPTDESLEAFVLQWFAQMHAGQLDRSQLAPEYSAHLSDDAIRQMSEYLKAYHFGASPTGCHIMRKDRRGEQTFCVAKVLFPRGDAASLLFGFDKDSKITGMSLMGMAGD